MADILDLADRGIAPLVHALARREASALDACDAAIARIEALDGEINAVVVRDFERAREQARAADKRLAAGERGPLLGVPMTVKESFNIAGLPTTWGLAPFKDFRAQDDALPVQRLKQAGAVILGKTNVPPALGDWQSVNPIYGRTVNPLDHTRSPGGSSGGGAAALAAKMVPIELGSDIGGSIRVPAAFCGVLGHKATYGLLPSRGHQPPASDGRESTQLAVIGPLARSAGDLDTMLGLLAPPAEPEAQALRLQLAPPRATRWRGARVLLIDAHPTAATSESVRAAIASLADDLAREGATVARSSPLLPDLGEAHPRYVKMLMTVITRGAPDAPPPISSHEWLALIDHQQRLQRQWAALFEQFDAVIAPAFSTVAFPHDDREQWKERTLTIDGEETPYGDHLAWPGVATFPGLPATAVPIARDGLTGMPIGVQVIGPRYEDRTTIAIAGLIQALRG